MSNVDTTRWHIKRARVADVTKQAAETAAGRGADILLKRVVEHVSGQHVAHWIKRHPAIGKMPIPRRTGMLAQSIRRVKVLDGLHAVYSDTNVAPYALFVHDGTKHMRGRPFIGLAVREKREEIVAVMREAIKSTIRSTGR